MKFKTIKQVWAAIDSGKTVYWASDAYQLTIEDTKIEWRKACGYDLPFTNRNGKCLRVTCMSNWFGSLLEETELSKLYTKG